MTKTSATLIDFVLANNPESISNSGVVNLGISDHSLIFAVPPPPQKKTNGPIKNFEILKILMKDNFSKN